MTATSAVASAASGGASAVALLPHSDRLRSELAFTALSPRVCEASTAEPPAPFRCSPATAPHRQAPSADHRGIATPGSVLDRQAAAPVIGGMRLLLVAALVLMAGAAGAPAASQASAATPPPAPHTAAKPPAAPPAPAKGRAAAPAPAPALTPAQIAAREKALDAEAKR